MAAAGLDRENLFWCEGSLILRGGARPDHDSAIGSGTVIDPTWDRPEDADHHGRVHADPEGEVFISRRLGSPGRQRGLVVKRPGRAPVHVRARALSARVRT